MIYYLIRRFIYAFPLLLGVNLITFVLFFVVNSPDDMARMQLGVKRVTPEAIEKEVGNILASYGKGSGHVFNLGHGISQFTPPEHAGVLVEAVHRLSRQYHAA